MKDVAYAEFQREAIDMLNGATIPRLSHILKSILKNANSKGWMKTIDKKHMS